MRRGLGRSIVGRARVSGAPRRVLGAERAGERASCQNEILHRARLSPIQLTSRPDDDGIERLYRATREVVSEWIDRPERERQGGFPEKVTAFREEMAVHGRYRKPCPVCATEVQRIVYAENETNYFPRCQTEGKLLADRSLSRLLKKDWPRSIEELESRRRASTAS